MAYTISEYNAVNVLEIKTLLNELDNKKILEAIQSRIEGGTANFVVDLSELDFMNSIGLNFLISAMTKSRDNGGLLTVASPSEQVIKLLEITKLKSFFKLSPTVEEALKSYSNQNPN